MIRRGHILLFLMALCFSTEAQEQLSYGIDPTRDSIAFARYRSHMDDIRRERPTVALVLSGGGAKGAAHISVIKHLERAGIPVDLVLGTSIGGLVGGLYACGYNGEELESIIRNLDWDDLLRDRHPRSYDALSQKDYDRRYQLSIPFGTYKWDFHTPQISRRSVLRDGIVQGRNIEDLFSSLLVGYGDEVDFLSLPIPFACVATDMISAKPKVWFSGSLVEALRSTMSIPGLFTPVKRDGMVLMDGGMRSNYPAEIAKQMGADIIIGVDISSPSLDASQMRSMLDIVFQANDVLGRDSYMEALALTDIYIQPELSDFSLLSFDKESINTIIERGRIAVEDVSDQIDSLSVRLGHPHVRHSHNPFIAKAKNLQHTTIRVDSISFNGITQSDERFLRHTLHLESKGPRTIHINELEDAISEIIGTKAFEKATYQLLGAEEPYTLLFNCYRAPVNQLGASVRFDSRDFASILLHYGINTHQLTGSRLDFSARLGFDTRLAATYTLVTGRGINFGTTFSFQSVRNGDFRVDDYGFNVEYNRGIADAHIILAPWHRMNISMGFQLDYCYRTSFLSNNILVVQDLQTVEKSNINPIAYLQARHDSFDDPYFPTRGVMYQFKYNYYLPGLQHETPQAHAVQFGMRVAASNGRLTFIPSLDVRYVTDNMFPYTNMLSVSDANRILEQQITFIGISTPYSCMRMLGSMGLDARVRIGKRHYLTAAAQLLHEADGIDKIGDSEQSRPHIGLALEYAYSSIVGPLRFNLHWSDMTKSVGAYLGIGLDF